MVRKVQRPKALDRNKMKHWPRWSQPKIDGCRAYNPQGILLARTQKEHANRYVTEQFSKEYFIGLDGEMAAGHECNPALCRLTTSALSTVAGQPFVLWWLFDYITDDTVELPYRDRYALLELKIKELQVLGLGGHLRLVPYIECHNIEQIDAAHEQWLKMGYEGSCVYDPSVRHKEGDSTPTQRGVLRIKDFIDIEGVILGVTEGEKNNNYAQTNELGRTFRTSHQENKEPNGMVGSIQMRALEDVVDPQTKVLLVAKGSEFTAAPGALTHDERKFYFENQHHFVEKIGKVKFFPKGVKDKPRFPQFFSLRSPEDR